MGMKRDAEFEAKLQKAGFKAVIVPSETTPPPASVTIEGTAEQDDAALIKLLEDTASFIRAAGNRTAAQPYEQREMNFQRLSLGDTISLKHRS